MDKNHQIISLRLANLFVEHYGYELVQIESTTGNIFLSSPKHSKYPFIKIFLDSVFNYPDTANDMVTSVNNMNRVKRDLELLSFSFVDETQLKTNHQIVGLTIENDFPTQVLQHFPKLKNLNWQINDSTNELKDVVAQINRSSMKNRQTKQRQRLMSGSKGTFVIIAINVIMYLLGIFISRFASEPTTYMIALGGLYVPMIQGAYEVLRFIFAGFVHASVTHLLFNMLSLYNLSILLEKAYGTKKFVLVLLASIIGGNLFVYIADTTAALSVGLSTGIYGLLGLLIVYLIESKLIRAPMLRNQLLWILGINLMINFLPNISWLGHLGGFVTGVFAGIIISKKYEWLSLRKNMIVASVLAVIISGYLAVARPKPQKIYYGSDLDVISVWRKLGMNFYADYIENRLNNYYFIEEGVVR